MIDSKFNFLFEQFSRFIELNDDEKARYIPKLKVIKAKKGTLLLEPGNICKLSYFINKGIARVYYINSEGKEVISYFAFKGWWASDLESFNLQTPSRKFIEIIEDAELFIISKNDFDQTFIDIPKLERYWRIVGVNSYVAHIKRIEEFQELPANKRYEKLISQFPDIETRIKQKYIASYLGIAPESLSAIKKLLKD